ncbi:cytochrome C oxidase [Tropilaelaps mercedesae]|uniref:Cytochrome C oxidase n=1 Tax=Tropilaelaps mercedesae TaxID=418985 RepID=A0A1V9XPM6_9ACAR|nr:cytochrome C oxidase [Tropilaelaps mercedesae]
MQRVLTTAVRRFASAAKGAHDHEASMNMWRKITLFIGFPAIGVSMVNAYLAEKEHEAHYKRPEFVKYDHMYIRTKKFPWGDGNRTLFHNPKTNALPEGYEDEL